MKDWNSWLSKHTSHCYMRLLSSSCDDMDFIFSVREEGDISDPEEFFGIGCQTSNPRVNGESVNGEREVGCELPFESEDCPEMGENLTRNPIDLTSRQQTLLEFRHAEEESIIDAVVFTNPVELHLREYLAKFNTTDRQLDDLLKMLQNISQEDPAHLRSLPVTARSWRRRDHANAWHSRKSLEQGGSNLLRKVLPRSLLKVVD